MNWISEPKPQLEVDSAFLEPHGSPNRFRVDKEVQREEKEAEEATKERPQ